MSNEKFTARLARARATENERLLERIKRAVVEDISEIQQDITILPEILLERLVAWCAVEVELSNLDEKHRCDTQLKMKMATAELVSIEQARRLAKMRF